MSCKQSYLAYTSHVMFLQRFWKLLYNPEQIFLPHLPSQKKKEISGAVIFEIVEAEAKDYHWGKIRNLSLSTFFLFNNSYISLLLWVKSRFPIHIILMYH